MGEMIKEQEMSSGKITLEQRKAFLHYHVQEYRKRRVIIDTDAACEAANTVLHCGGDIWLIPNNVYGTMHIGFGEIQRRIAPYGEIGRLLYENLISFYEAENASWSAGESWSLGDSPAVGVTLEPNCGSFMYCKAPEVQEDTSYRYPENSPQIRVYTSINSRFIIEDFISKLQILYG